MAKPGFAGAQRFLNGAALGDFGAQRAVERRQFQRRAMLSDQRMGQQNHEGQRQNSGENAACGEGAPRFFLSGIKFEGAP